MSYITNIEQLGCEEGLQQGRHEALALVRNLLKQKVLLAAIKSAAFLKKNYLRSKNLKDLYLTWF